MSVTELHPASGCTETHPDCPSIQMVIEPKEKELGGFSVRRSLPYVKQRMVGPWVFFDHMGPADFEPEEGIDVRPHPHIGLATVTYLFDGEILHRDSLGSVQAIRPGAINLMVAGKGIAHSERTPEALRQYEQHVEGLQLWLALPDGQEEIEPQFFHYDAGQLPLIHEQDAVLRVMVGTGFGATSPVQTYSPTFFAEGAMKQGATLDFDATYSERAVYVAHGCLRIDGQSFGEHSMLILTPDRIVTLEAEAYTRLVLIAGEPVGKRHIWWNFVSSSKERIEQAKEDWQQGRFPTIPDDNAEFIPLPDS